MRKCKFCGYISKTNYVNCPKCGGNEYEVLDNLSGYKVKDAGNVKLSSIELTIKKEKENLTVYIILALVVFAVALGFNSLISTHLIDSYTFESTSFIDATTIYLINFFGYTLFLTACLLHIADMLNRRIIIYLLYIPFVIIWSHIISYVFDDMSVFKIVFSQATFIINLFGLIACYFFALLLSKSILNISSGKRNNKLIKKGVIIKNIPYTLVADKNNSKFKRISVEYISKNNLKYTLLSKQLINYTPDDEAVDLLIDEDDVSNYFIDFEIL